MRYKDLIEIKDEDFKRITGVRRETFFSMLEEFRKNKPKPRGEKPKLSYEDQVLVLLRYYRYYDTFLKISYDYPVSEATISRIVSKVERILIKSSLFHLPNRKELLSPNIEVVLIDATESQIERPKKNKNIGIVVRKKGIHTSLK